MIDKIRNLINQSYRTQDMILPDSILLNKFCSSMDVVGDVHTGIWEYEKSESIGYLQLYGLLQAFFMQQDAVTSMADVVDIKLPGNQHLMRIRKIRNDAVGHPTNRGTGSRKSFHYISRASISKSGFTMLTHLAATNKDDFININVNELICHQKNGIENQLEIIYNKMRSLENAHREEHQTMKLTTIFHPNISYLFKNIFESCYSDYRFGQAKTNVRMIRKMIEKFEVAVNDRGDYTGEGVNKCKYALDNLDMFYSNESDFDRQAAEVYCEYLEKRVDELKAVAAELDQKYANRV